MYNLPVSFSKGKNVLLWTGSGVTVCFKYLLYLTLRLLMSYIYIYMERLFLMFLDHTHNDAAQSVGLLWTSHQLIAETST
jgi:hypothetical protein